MSDNDATFPFDLSEAVDAALADADGTLDAKAQYALAEKVYKAVPRRAFRPLLLRLILREIRDAIARSERLNKAAISRPALVPIPVRATGAAALRPQIGRVPGARELAASAVITSENREAARRWLKDRVRVDGAEKLVEECTIDDLRCLVDRRRRMIVGTAKNTLKFLRLAEAMTRLGAVKVGDLPEDEIAKAFDIPEEKVRRSLAAAFDRAV